MSWRTKVGRRLAWGYKTASDGQWQQDGRIRRFMPTWKYRNGLLVAGLILFARWYWPGVVVRLMAGEERKPRPDNVFHLSRED